MDPAFGNQIQRTFYRRVIAEVYLDIVIACDALVLAAPKGIQVPIVQVAHNVCHILAVVVDCADDLMRSGDRDDFGALSQALQSARP